jgi:parallel beta-helix repeat protein
MAAPRRGWRSARWPLVAAGATALLGGLLVVVLLQRSHTRVEPAVCEGVDIAPGQDLQAAVDGHPAGTTFCLAPGLYQGQSVTPKRDDRFIGTKDGSGEVVLSGARTLTAFNRQGDVWAVGGQTQQSEPHGECTPDAPRCGYDEDLYLDDRLLAHVADRADVGAGRWYFDYDADTIYLGDDPAGRRVETTVTPRAFGGDARGVVLRGLTVEKYANSTQNGAIYAEGAGGWVIDDVTARWNHGAGLGYTRSDHMTIQRSRALENGQIGIVGDGDDARIVDNEIAGNNTAGVDPGWEAGGAKFGESTRVAISGNYSHDNRGPGLWTDYANRDVLYEKNRVVHNAGAGIFHEISYNAVIRDNVVEGNGYEDHPWCYGAGIQVSASRDVEVSGNTLRDNARSIVGIAQVRGDEWQIVDLDVHDNVVDNRTVSDSTSGICRDDPSLDVYASASHNRYDANQYMGSGNGWSWDDAELDFRDWQAAGNDRAGSYEP